jgi:hypothetical protein
MLCQVPAHGRRARDDIAPDPFPPELDPALARGLGGSHRAGRGLCPRPCGLGGGLPVGRLAAAERRSFRSGPARRDFAPWLVGPLGHRLHSLSLTDLFNELHYGRMGVVYGHNP